MLGVLGFLWFLVRLISPLIEHSSCLECTSLRDSLTDDCTSGLGMNITSSGDGWSNLATCGELLHYHQQSFAQLLPSKQTFARR